MRIEGLEVILTPADAFDRSMLLEDLGGIDPALDLYLRTERTHLNQRSVSEAQETLSAAADPPSVLSAARSVVAARPFQRAGLAGDDPCPSGAGGPGRGDRCIGGMSDRAGRNRPHRPVACDPRPVRSAAFGRPAEGAAIRAGFRLVPSAAGRHYVRSVPHPERSHRRLALGLTEELVLALAPFRWMSCVPLFSISEDWRDTGPPACCRSLSWIA